MKCLGVGLADSDFELNLENPLNSAASPLHSLAYVPFCLDGKGQKERMEVKLDIQGVSGRFGSRWCSEGLRKYTQHTREFLIRGLRNRTVVLPLRFQRVNSQCSIFLWNKN